MSNYSIYIPRVFNNISNQKIINAFHENDIGTISSIDVKHKIGLDGSCYNVVFIHFSNWNEDNTAAINLRERIENPDKEARLVYDDPWYWILLPNTSASKQEYRYRPQMISIQSCFDRIIHIENELTNIYNELLYKNTYIPVNYSNSMESNDIESCSPSFTSVAQSNISPMTIDELMVDLVDQEQYQDNSELHKTQTQTQTHSLESTLSEVSCEYKYDFELDIESGSGSSVVDYECGSSIESKQWMTIHFCGND